MRPRVIRRLGVWVVCGVVIVHIFQMYLAGRLRLRDSKISKPNSMSPKPFFIARHGHRADMLPPNSTLADRIYPEDTPAVVVPVSYDNGRYHDPYLSPEGVVQALDLGNYLAKKCKLYGITKLHLFVSPYLRTIQTATALSLGLKQADIKVSKLYLEPAVREWHKTADHESAVPFSSPDQFKQLLPLIELDEDYQNIYPYPTYDDIGETIEQIHSRCHSNMRKLVEFGKALPRDETFVIVSHAATKIALIRGLLGRNFSPIRNGLCSLSTIIEDCPNDVSLPEQYHKVMVLEESRNKTIGYLYETSFLKTGEQKVWAFTEIID